ncbi:ATP-grasp domain-containing protein [Priestia abyssalis]|uniref:ATP-grasp domain-containing protein n=1 Tax=Priestia abyssalis TaxID=1221450 RepID=UPI00099539E1|nr:ATP-grasp domain-containing protein [Priestia abyssalis]
MKEPNKHLAIICQNKHLPFIFEEAKDLDVHVTFFYDDNDSRPENLVGVDTYIPIALFDNPEESLEVVKQLHKEHPIDGIITLFEPALDFVAKVAEVLKLPYLPPSIISNCRNKNKTRKILEENKLNTPIFYELSLDENIEDIDFCFPLIVKPANGFSSQGVIRVNNKEELSEAIKKVKKINEHDLSKFVQDNHGIVIEQFIDGPEFAIETFSIQGDVHVLSIGYKGDIKGPFFEEGVYIAPAKLDEKVKNAIVEEVTRAVKALHIENGPAHTELRLNQNRVPYVLEVGARIGGSGVSHYIVKESTGINYIKLAIKNAFGILELDSIPSKIVATNVAGNYIIPVKGSGIFEKIKGLENLKDDKRVKRIFQFINEGTEILPYPHFSGYPGFILTSHDSYQDCEEFYKELDEEIEIIYKNNITV